MHVYIYMCVCPTIVIVITKATCGIQVCLALIFGTFFQCER